MSEYKIDKLECAEWKELVEASPYRSPFHAYSWCSMSANSLNYEFDAYLVSQRDNRWLLPIYNNGNDIRVSLIGYGGPLRLSEVTDGRTEAEHVSEILIMFGALYNSRAIHGLLYPANFWPSNLDSSKSTETVIVSLGADADSIFENTLTGNARTSLRKSVKEGVEVIDITLNPSDEDIYTALELLNTTQLSVKSSYLTSLELFKDTVNLNESQDVASSILFAKLGGVVIAMSLVIHNSREAFHLYSGWNRRYSGTCAVQALHWSNIQLAVSRGNTAYNMGSSHSDSLRKSKLRWGGSLFIIPKVV